MPHAVLGATSGRLHCEGELVTASFVSQSAAHAKHDVTQCQLFLVQTVQDGAQGFLVDTIPLQYPDVGRKLLVTFLVHSVTKGVHEHSDTLDGHLDGVATVRTGHNFTTTSSQTLNAPFQASTQEFLDGAVGVVSINYNTDNRSQLGTFIDLVQNGFQTVQHFDEPAKVATFFGVGVRTHYAVLTCANRCPVVTGRSVHSLNPQVALKTVSTFKLGHVSKGRHIVRFIRISSTGSKIMKRIIHMNSYSISLQGELFQLMANATANACHGGYLPHNTLKKSFNVRSKPEETRISIHYGENYCTNRHYSSFRYCSNFKWQFTIILFDDNFPQITTKIITTVYDF